MKIRFRIGKVSFFAQVKTMGKVTGVNSKLPDGSHFLMWDFDDVPITDVMESLGDIQATFKLPTIHILATGIDQYFHAYCFKSCAWSDVLKILAETKHLDRVYFNIGVLRGYFTLRISDKKDRDFRRVVELRSIIEPDVDPTVLTSFVRYWSKLL